MSKCYIGITGPASKYEVISIVNEFEKAGFNLKSKHIPMLGFLISYKTLNGQISDNKRYPKFYELKNLIEVSNKKVFPMIHYNSRDKDSLHEQVERLFDGLYKDNLCRAVQLNIIYPPVDELMRIKKKMPDLQIVFQASSTMLKPDLVNRIKEYGFLIDYVLIDPSGGKGREFNLEKSVKIYNQFKEKTNYMIGFAGGFNGENVSRRVSDLINVIGNDDFFIDAEGGLRDKISNAYGDDLLNISKVSKYLSEAAKVLL